MNNNNQNKQGNGIYTNWNNNQSNNTSNSMNNNNIINNSNTVNNKNNTMYTRWEESSNQGSHEKKPYMIVSDKELKNKKRMNGALRFVVYGVFVIVGTIVFYMYQMDKYEFYPKKSEILIANKGSYQVELIPKRADNFDYLNYRYEVEDESIATVDEYGKVKALKEGETKLKIRYKNSLSYKTVNIKTENIEVEKIEIRESEEGKSKEEAIRIEEESTKIETIVNEREDVHIDVEYRSSNPEVVEVDEHGNINPISEGEAVIVGETEEGVVGEKEVVVEKPKEEVERIELVESKIEIRKGTTGKITPIIVPEGAETGKISYQSNNRNIRVDSEGNIIGNNIGTSLVTIRSENGVTAYLTVEVKENRIEVEGIDLNPKNLEIKKGEEYQLRAIINPSGATERELIWESSNSGIVSVKDGKVKGIKEGEAEVSVRTKDGRIKEKSKIIVKSDVIEVKKVTIKDSKVSIKQGSKYNIQVEIEPKEATNQKISYKASNGNIVVDGTGVVQGKTVGTSVITVTSNNGKTATIEVTVEEDTIEASKVSLDKREVVINVGEYIQLIGTIEPKGTTLRTLTWSSSKPSVVSVSNGKVVGKTAGEAEIIAITANGKAAKCKVKVEEPVKSITITGGETIKVGEKTTYKIIFNPTNASDTSIGWKSDNIDVATVDQKGNIVGKGVGTAKITATIKNGKTATKTITVKAIEKAVEKIQINPSSVTIKEKKTASLSVSITPSDATKQGISWKSSNTSIVTVDQKGVVKGIKKGEATITATAENGKKTTCKVIVEEVEVEVKKISLNITDTSILSGESIKLKAKVEPNNATNKDITWTSSDKKIAEVEQNGKVIIGSKTGTVKITAKTSNDVKAICVILVKEKEINATSITLDNSSIDMNIGETKRIIATISPDNVTNNIITWSSSDENIATVNNKGVITTLKPGTVKITAKTSNGLKAICKINVNIAFTWKDAYEKDLNPDTGGGAARVYPLPNGTLIGAYEKGMDIYTRISTDNGKTWTSPKLTASVDGLNCANINFYYYSNKLYMAYRAIGTSSKGYYTSLHVNVSSDFGYTWKHHSKIIDRTSSSNSVYRGVWEPYLGSINGKLTVFYANDSYSQNWQNIESLTWNGKEWTDKKVISNGQSHGSRDGMPAWIQLSNGQYALVIEAFESGYEFVIKLLYSNDGVNWSSPKTIYRPTKKGSKVHAAAPGIAELSTGQIVVSFQTNESGDNIVKTIYSKNVIPVDKIQATDFTDSEVVFKKTSGIWSGISYKDGWLYMGGGTYMKRIYVG